MWLRDKWQAAALDFLNKTPVGRYLTGSLITESSCQPAEEEYWQDDPSLAELLVNQHHYEPVASSVYPVQPKMSHERLCCCLW